MDNTIVSKLQELGLSEKEAALYLELLKFNESTAQELSLVTKLNRSSIYVLLQELTRKGFAKEVAGAEKLTYSAEDPEKLLAKAEDAIHLANKIKDEMTSLAENLNNLQTTHRGVPYSSFVEGKEGLRALKQEVADFAKNTAVCGCVKTIPNIVFIKKAKELRLIANTDINLNSQDTNESVRLIPFKEYPFTSDFFVFGNRIILISDTEEFGVRIESAEFAEVLRETFELAWAEASRIDAKLRKTSKK